MKSCKEIQTLIPDYFLGVLSPEKQVLVDEHIRDCSDCRRIWDEEKKLNESIVNAKIDVSEAFLQENRERLHANLLRTNHQSIPIFKRLVVWFGDYFRLQYVYQFAGILAILFLGIWVGERVHPFGGRQQELALSQKLNLSNFDNWNGRARILSFDPHSQTVALEIDQTRKTFVRGELGSPQIQQLLAHSLQFNVQDGQRLRAIRILNQTSKNAAYFEKYPEDVVLAICNAARKDPNPGVRLKAIRTLGHFKSDSLSKGTLISILQNDSIPALRYEALNVLVGEPSKDVTPLLQMLARKDSGSVLRLRAENELRKIEKRKIENRNNIQLIKRTKK